MQKQITELEKAIYNKHLAVSRSQRNKPFRLKKDFSDFQNTDKSVFLKRLSVLFQKHPEINLDVFFKAPYVLYPDVDYFGLDYFASMRAIKCYAMYKKQVFLQDPDSQLEEVKQSLRFIANFCISQKIYLHQYPFHRTADLYSWMIHYKENKINIYSVFEFSGVFSSIKELTEEVQNFFISGFVEQFQNLFVKYNNSKEIKPYMRKAFSTISTFVENHVVKP
jgi:hypothetical protein